MRYVVNWKFFLEEAHTKPTMGGQFSVLAKSIVEASELAIIDAFNELDKVQAMVPMSCRIQFSIHDPADMACLAWSVVDVLGQYITGKPQTV